MMMMDYYYTHYSLHMFILIWTTKKAPQIIFYKYEAGKFRYQTARKNMKLMKKKNRLFLSIMAKRKLSFKVN